MAWYRRIDMRIWGDSKFRELSSIAPSGQGLWIYLLTGPHNDGPPGLFRIGPAGIAEARGWPYAATRKCFDELIERSMIQMDESRSTILIPNAIEYSPPANPNQMKCWLRALDLVPEGPLRDQWLENLHERLKADGHEEWIRPITTADSGRSNPGQDKPKPHSGHDPMAEAGPSPQKPNLEPAADEDPGNPANRSRNSSGNSSGNDSGNRFSSSSSLSQSHSRNTAAESAARAGLEEVGKAGKAEKDEARMQEWNSWIDELIIQAEKDDGVDQETVHGLLDSFIMAVDAFYEFHGGSFTPTKRATLAKRLRKHRSVVVLFSMELFIDQKSGQADERYLTGICRKRETMGDKALAGAIERHRSSMAGRGVAADLEVKR